MVYAAGLGHLGGEFSATDILVTLYFGVLRVDPARPDAPDRDRFILSKGHSAAALYVTLAEAGFFDRRRARRPSWRRSPAERPPRPQQGARASRRTPVRSGTASRSRSAWRSRQARMARRPAHLRAHRRRRAAGGQHWEAAMAAGHFGLDNLVAIVDRNRLQQGDATERDDPPRAARRQVARLRLGCPRGRRPRPRRAPRRLRRGPVRGGRAQPRHRPHPQGPGVSFMRDGRRGTTRSRTPTR